MKSKSIWQSKTMWFNLTVSVLTGLTAVTDTLKPLLSDGGYAVLLIFVTVGNAWLRTITTVPIERKK